MLVCLLLQPTSVLALAWPHLLLVLYVYHVMGLLGVETHLGPCAGETRTETIICLALWLDGWLVTVSCNSTNTIQVGALLQITAPASPAGCQPVQTLVHAGVPHRTRL